MLDPAVEPADAPTDGDLKLVATLAQDVRRQQRLVDRLTDDLARAGETLRRLTETDLPRAMIACGYAPGDKNIVVGGLTLELKDLFRCGQLDDNGPTEDKPFDGRPGLAWLEAEGHGDLARRVVAVTLGKGSEELAVEIIQLLRSHRAGNSLNITNKCTVPWNTLSSFSKEQIAQGGDPPLAMLGVTRLTVVKVTQKDRGEA